MGGNLVVPAVLAMEKWKIPECGCPGVECASEPHRLQSAVLPQEGLSCPGDLAWETEEVLISIPNFLPAPGAAVQDISTGKSGSSSEPPAAGVG